MYIIWRIFKIIGVVIGIFLILFAIVTWIVFERKNDWLEKQIQSYMNESHSGQLKIKSVELKLFRNFPNVTVEFDGVDFFEHRDSLHSLNEKQIIQADKIFVAFELLPLFRNELKISVINLYKAQLNIFEYKDGKLNIDLALAKPVKKVPVITNKNTTTKANSNQPPKVKSVVPIQKKAPLQIDLNYIYLEDLRLTWNSADTSKSFIVHVLNTSVDITNEEKVLSAKLHLESDIQSLYVKGKQLPESDLLLKAIVDYDKEKQSFNVKESEIKYATFSANMLGSYSAKENGKLDLNVDATSNDLEFLSLFIKPSLIKENPDLLKRNDVYLKARLFGELKKNPLQIDATFGLKNISFRLPMNLGTFQNIGFEGKFTSPNINDLSETRLEIKNLRGQLPGGFIKGEVILKNLSNPQIRYNLNTRLKLDGYDKIFKLDFLKNLKGTISVLANYKGPLKIIAKHEMQNYRSSIIKLDNLSFLVSKTNQLVSGLSVEIETKNNQSEIKELKFNYGRNDVKINATIDNLLYLLFYNENDINISGNLHSGQFFTKDFILDSLSDAQVKDRLSNLSFDFNIKNPTDIKKDSSFISKIYFDISNLTTNLDKLPDIKLLNMNGWFSQTPVGLKLGLDNFHATMPYGKIDITGDLAIPRKNIIQFNARVKMHEFPWTYIQELISEIKTDQEPNSKNLPLDKMEVLNCELDLSSELITYPFDIEKLDVRKSRASFHFPGSKLISTENLNLSFDNFYFNHPENSGSIIGMKSSKGKIEMKALHIPGLHPFNINMYITGENDKLNIIFSRVAPTSIVEKGELKLDLSKKEPAYHLNYAVSGADLEYFIKRFYNSKFMSGKMNYVIDITASGSTWQKAKLNMSGIIEINADSIQLYGIDIDDVITKFKKSQNFNLTDLGAVLVAGPVGLAVTKGSDFVSLARVNFDSTRQSKIYTMLSKWKLENRQLITEDVAITTKLNRIAIDGRIDFANDSIPGLTVAVVDKNGCSLMDQKLYGKMNALKTGKLNITKTIFGSVINSVNTVVGKDCTPVYTGKVKNPTQQK